jgi:hypothetical protein
VFHGCQERITVARGVYKVCTTPGVLIGEFVPIVEPDDDRRYCDEHTIAQEHDPSKDHLPEATEDGEVRGNQPVGGKKLY